MKKIFVLLCVLGAVLFSCIVEYESVTYYKITNQSLQNIKINIPNYRCHSSVSIDTTFSISQNQQIEFKYIDSGRDITELFGLANTAFIIFNDSDTLLYTREDNSSRNILKKESYDIRVEEKKRITTYYCTYIITEEDYQNAVNSKKE